MKAQTTRRPDILLCVFDSLAACETGSTGDSFVTPVLDKLQKQSAVFTAAYSASPESSPARVSLFTGLDPSVHGVWTNGVELPIHEETFPQLLTQAGYTSWLAGRRQLAGVSNWTTEHSRAGEYTRVEWAHGPLHRSRQNAYLNWLQETDPERYAQVFPRQANPDDTVIPAEQYTAVASLPDELSFNYWVGQRICDLIDSHQQEQPFLAVAAFSVGASLGAGTSQDDDNEEVNERALQQADTALGQILAQLPDNKDEETVVIVTAGRGNAVSGNQNSTMQERAIKVPLFLRSVEQTPQTVNDPVSTIDIAPTILDIAGLPQRARLQGTSLLDVLAGTTPPRSWAMSRLRNGEGYESSDEKRNWQTALRANNMKLIVNHGNTQTGEAASYRLFDLVSDPDERNDLATDANYANDLEDMIDLMIDARCALEDRTEPRIAKF